jgi:uncharacterized protein YqjF (DUF2071 family)
MYVFSQQTTRRPTIRNTHQSVLVIPYIVLLRLEHQGEAFARRVVLCSGHRANKRRALLRLLRRAIPAGLEPRAYLLDVFEFRHRSRDAACVLWGRLFHVSLF